MGTKEEVGLKSLRQAIKSCLDNELTMTRARELFCRELLIAYLAHAGNNRHRLADEEGVHRNTITRTLRRMGIETDLTWVKRRPRRQN